MSKYNSDVSVNKNIQNISEGNPGALSALKQVQQKLDVSEEFSSMDDLLSVLDEMQLYGSRIWIGFNEICDNDAELFLKRIEQQDENMVELINANSKERFDEVTTVEL